MKNKTDKNQKRTWNNILFGCKDYTHNFRPHEVKMINKVFREKSNCMVCQSNKSRFLRQKHNNKKQFFQITKHAYVL